MKVRGTAQTVAEKYMQLGRDAHSAGDNVMAESYYQFAEHYFRVLQSVQPPGQLAPQLLRRPGEDSEEEVEGGENDEMAAAGEGSAEGGDTAGQGHSEDSEGAAEAGQQGASGARQERPRDNESRDSNNNRERFRPRWQQRRNERGPEGGRDEPQGHERPTAEGNDAPQSVRREAEAQPEAEGNWEAPSFLTRPVPQVASDEAEADAGTERRPRGRRPKVAAVEETAPVTTGDE